MQRAETVGLIDQKLEQDVLVDKHVFTFIVNFVCNDEGQCSLVSGVW